MVQNRGNGGKFAVAEPHTGHRNGRAMPAEKKPREIILGLVAERAGCSDAEVLAEIEQLAPLRDEGSSVWDDQSYWIHFALRYVALADVAAARRLRPAVRLLLERACNGDPGELMRGLRHPCERIFDPDWSALADVCMELCQSMREGTRVWATHQLMILDDPRAKPVFERALNDEIEAVRSSAAAGLSRLARLAKKSHGVREA